MNPCVVAAVLLCCGAVCRGQTMLPDSWYIRNSGTTNALHGIASGDVFLAAGDSATVVTSPDGSDWTPSSVSGGGAFLFAAHVPSGYAFFVGGAGGVYASTDGAIWTNILSTPLNTQFFGCAYNNASLYGVQIAAWDAVANTSRIYSSWNLFDLRPTAHPTTNALFAIASAPPFTGQTFPVALYVAVGDRGTIISSADGTNWVLRDSGTTVPLRAVAYHQGRMLAGGDDGVIVTSSDGISWSAAERTSFNIRGLASSGLVVVAVGNDSGTGRLQVSPDVLTWSGTALEFSNALNAVAYAQDCFVAVGDGGVVVQSSYAPSSRENAWTKKTSGYWEEPYWSLGHLPCPNDPSVVFQNPGRKELTIGPNTVANSSNSLTMSSLTIGAPPGSSNTLILNYAGTNAPLTVGGFLTVETNGSLISYGSAVSAGVFRGSSSALFADGSRLDAAADIGVTGNLTLSNSLARTPYLFARQHGIVTQSGGVSDIDSILIDGDSVFKLSTGSITVHSLWLAGYPNFPAIDTLTGGATFIQASGDATIDMISLGDLRCHQGTYVFQGGTFYSPRYVFKCGTFAQEGGTNTLGSLTIPEAPPLLYAGDTAGTYELSGGTLLSGGLTLGVPGLAGQKDFTKDGRCLLSQSGGLHINSDGIIIPGFLMSIFMSAYQVPHCAASYALSGGTLLSPELRAAFGGYFQTGGTNYTGSLSVGSYSMLTAGELVTSNTTVYGYRHNGYEPCKPSLGFTQTNGTHSVQNKLLVRSLAIYDLQGGALNAQDIAIDPTALLACGDGIISNWGTFVISGGVFRAGSQSHCLGKLQATNGSSSYWCPSTNSILDVTGPPGTVLRFRDSRDSQIAGVQILNWQPWTAGGSSHHIFFGTNAQALTQDQLQQLIFVNPLGWPPGNYAAQILATGEIVPAEPPSVVATRLGRSLVLSWPGNYDLFTATNLPSPFLAIPAARSPFTNDFTDRERYFRLGSRP